jgi:hypothetical protein
MAWNLFERIINAFKPKEEPQQGSEQAQPWLEEDSVEQPQGSEEPSQSFEQMAGMTQENEWQS